MSNKTPTQAGRRTPLSLSGTVSKSNSNKSSNNGGGNNATSSNNNKQDNKSPQKKNDTQINSNTDVKENSNKKQQLQTEKKQQQNDNKKITEKNSNGANSNKQQPNENKQHQQNKEKQQQNGDNDVANEKEKKEKLEKSDKLDKHEKSEKVNPKLKEDKKIDQEKADNKKEEKKTKEVKDSKADDKEEDVSKSDVEAEQDQIHCDDNDAEEGNQEEEEEEEKQEEINENVEMEEQQPEKQCSPPVTPKSGSKTLTPVTKTPTKLNEQTPQKSMTTGRALVASNREVTTTIDEQDVVMEPLAIDSSPIKSSQPEEGVSNINTNPSAASTPGSIILQKPISDDPKSDTQLAMQTDTSPTRPRVLSQISGRKSIRPTSDITTPNSDGDMLFQESYRLSKLQQDVTNTSLNVTVGSEVPCNTSFSLFSRGRKRDHTPIPYSQSATDIIAAAKKARLENQGFLNAVSTPITLLRNHFSRMLCSTPNKKKEAKVKNVSDESQDNEKSETYNETTEINSIVNKGNNGSLREESEENKLPAEMEKEDKLWDIEKIIAESDIKFTDTPLLPAVGDPLAKNKRCNVM